MRSDLPKRFYREASVVAGEHGFALTLDGRPARTPAKAPLQVPTRCLAEALAVEWNAQEEVIDPAAMPLTRIVNSAIDGVAAEMDAVSADIVAYVGSDLICYRADGPEELVRRQLEAWEPVLSWFEAWAGSPLNRATGVIHVEQPQAALEAAAEAVAGLDAFGLAALGVMTTLTGSAILAFAVARGRLEPEAAWAAAHVDEDYQIEKWGEDAEAMARRAARWREMDAAARLLSLSRQRS
jgi:chaperone required for assembly of F1-ATPase